jgi:DNA-binding transcriptional MerR regulator
MKEPSVEEQIDKILSRENVGGSCNRVRVLIKDLFSTQQALIQSEIDKAVKEAIDNHPQKDWIGREKHIKLVRQAIKSDRAELLEKIKKLKEERIWRDRPKHTFGLLSKKTPIEKEYLQALKDIESILKEGSR